MNSLIEIEDEHWTCTVNSFNHGVRGLAKEAATLIDRQKKPFQRTGLDIL